MWFAVCVGREAGPMHAMVQFRALVHDFSSTTHVTVTAAVRAFGKTAVLTTFPQ